MVGLAWFNLASRQAQAAWEPVECFLQNDVENGTHFFSFLFLLPLMVLCRTSSMKSIHQYLGLFVSNTFYAFIDQLTSGSQKNKLS